MTKREIPVDDELERSGRHCPLGLTDIRTGHQIRASAGGTEDHDASR